MRRSVVLVILLMAGLMCIICIVVPVDSPLFPKCPFRMLTGWNCPCCGLSRCLHALCTGRFREAFGYNAFLLCSVPYFAVVLFTECVLSGNNRKKMHRLLAGRTALVLYFFLFLTSGTFADGTDERNEHWRNFALRKQELNFYKPVLHPKLKGRTTKMTDYGKK